MYQVTITGKPISPPKSKLQTITFPSPVPIGLADIQAKLCENGWIALSVWNETN